MQFQISWLLKKPTDLDLHCLQRQDISGFSRTRVKKIFNIKNLKAPYSSKILDIIIQEQFYKLVYGINTIIKCGTWQPVKFQLVSRSQTRSKMKWFFFYRISELMFPTDLELTTQINKLTTSCRLSMCGFYSSLFVVVPIKSCAPFIPSLWGLIFFVGLKNWCWGVKKDQRRIKGITSQRLSCKYVRPFDRPSVTFISKFDIYVKVTILINYKTKQQSNLAWTISLTSWLCDIGVHFVEVRHLRQSYYSDQLQD